MKIQDWAIIAALGIIWGGSFLFNAILIRELGPLWVCLGRVGIASLGCWAFLIATKTELPTDWRIYTGLTLLGVINFSIPFSLIPFAQYHVNAGVAGIINALTPIMVVIVSPFWLGGEKANRRKSFGVFVAFASVALMALPAVQNGGGSEFWAMLFIVFSTFLYGIALNYTRKFNKVAPTVVATIALSGASIALAPVAIIVEGVPTIERIETWGALLYLGLIATTLTFLVVYRILERVGATNFSTTTFIAPISAVILGVLVLGEQLQAIHVAGMIGIFVGILIIDGRIQNIVRVVKA